MSPSGPKYVHVPGTLFIMYIYSVLETCEDFIMYIYTVLEISVKIFIEVLKYKCI